jgi:phosphohistidine phosphatase
VSCNGKAENRNCANGILSRAPRRRGAAVGRQPAAAERARPPGSRGGRPRRRVENIEVAAILHSDKLRARQTAEILSRFVPPTQGIRQISGLEPEADPWIAKAELEAAAAPLMIVGHLPHLGRLAALLLTGDDERQSVEFTTATVVCLSWSGSLWKFSWSIGPEGR